MGLQKFIEPVGAGSAFQDVFPEGISEFGTVKKSFSYIFLQLLQTLILTVLGISCSLRWFYQTINKYILYPL
ncbi:MAG: hypothetical protein A2Y04_06180 [Omnitrophica WOR_2 bacterium GWC2_45_7]|nr:MAG: hypothetical protein A2Y04_06180 [Omnitrophica WOR_2 bacterium GWC2_45_7]